MNRLASINCLLLFCFLLLTGACKVQKDSGNSNTACTTNGTVKDFTGLDGCSLLIVLENGDKYLPEAPEFEGTKLEDGQQIRFGYETSEMTASICMAENKIVKLTCLEVNDTRPLAPECYNTEDPVSVKWMKAAIQKHNPVVVTKYTYRTDGWAYYYQGKTSYLYDCQGTLICDTKENDKNDCLRFVEDRTKGKVIWQGEGAEE